MRPVSFIVFFVILLMVLPSEAKISSDTKKSTGNLSGGEKLYQKHCSECHHPKRYGLTGPPLFSEYFGRKKKSEIKSIIKKGLPATNMPPFKELLKDNEIDQVVSFITSPAEKPVWTMNDMRATWEMYSFSMDDKKPRYDMSNFFMIVEGGAGAVHFMDGDSFKLLGKVEVGAIHGGPKYGRDLRYAYAVARDGVLVKYDLIDQLKVARVRGGISTRNIAVSSSGDNLAMANSLPKNIVIINTFSMKPVRIIEPGSTVGAVYSLNKKGEFVVSLKDKAELLFIDDKTFKVRTVKTDQPFTDFFIDPDEKFLVGTARGASHFSVFDLASGKVVEKVEISAGGMPHLASAAIWKDAKGRYAAFPHIGKALITVVDIERWKVRGEIKTKGSGFFARTHANIRHLWVDTGTDTIQLIDKATLKVAGEVVPKVGKRAMHIEFDKDGSNALVSVWEDDGEVVFYDTKTLKAKKRLPFKKPVGKYNATNKRF